MLPLAVSEVFGGACTNCHLDKRIILFYVETLRILLSSEPLVLCLHRVNMAIAEGSIASELKNFIILD